MRYNGNKFSVYESEEKTVLGLLGELGSQVNHNTEDLEKVKESDNKKVSHDEMNTIYKIDKNADFTGSWHGIKKPTASQEGLQATVDKIVEEDIPSINEQLGTKVSYPILNGEIGVINTQYEYGNILRYGCVGDGIKDNTEQFQNAIDSATAINCEVFCPIGVYVLNGTITLPINVKIKGVSCDKNLYDYYSSPSEFKGSIFLTYSKYVFYPKKKDQSNTQRTCVTIEDVLFYNKAQSTVKAMLFKLFVFHSSSFKHISTMDYDVVFYGGIAGNTLINNCHFGGIVRAFLYCLSNDNEEVGESIAGHDTGIVDSFICNNYINGKALATGAILFQSKSFSHSSITNNFIDYAKNVFSLTLPSTGVIISNNTFDVCYRVFKGCVSGFNITSNSFINIKYTQSYWKSLTDNEMIENEWCVLEPSSGFSHNVIVNNIASKSQKFAIMKDLYNVYNINIDKNSLYSYESDTPFEYSITRGSSSLDQKNIYIGDFMYRDYETLPNPKLSSGGVGRITTFDKQIIRYKNRFIYNNNGVWTNMDGSIFEN